MDTLLIVEDEPATRQYLKTLVQESGVRVGTIMECGDGDAAFQIVQRYRVDAMLTGIDMPGMDGLELVRRVHELAQPPLTVVITDSDDLLHVVRMMRNGAQEYVLKPIERERMNAILEALEAKWRERQRYSQTVRRLAMRMVFGVMLERELPEEELAALREIYEPILGELSFVVCAFQRGANVREQGKLLLFRETDDGCVCALEAKNLRPFLQSELPGGAAGISREHRSIEELFRAYAEATEARMRAFCQGGHAYYADAPQRAEGVPCDEELRSEQARSQRLQLLGARRDDELDACWDRLFDSVAGGRLQPAQLFEELRRFLREVADMYRGSLSGEDLRDIERCSHPLAFESLEAYRRAFMAWIHAQHERLVAKQDVSRNQARIEQAIAFIDENFASDLNMAVVSNQISMNYSLFSYLFKLQTGESFVTYLKQIRVREAQRLLVETDMKVLDISHQVGYPNEKHFMKVFRAYSGVSPSEYRRNMRASR